MVLNESVAVSFSTHKPILKKLRLGKSCQEECTQIWIRPSQNTILRHILYRKEACVNVLTVEVGYVIQICNVIACQWNLSNYIHNIIPLDQSYSLWTLFSIESINQSERNRSIRKQLIIIQPYFIVLFLLPTVRVDSTTINER